MSIAWLAREMEVGDFSPGYFAHFLLKEADRDVLIWFTLGDISIALSRYHLQHWQSVSKLSLWRLSLAMSGADCTTSMACRGVDSLLFRRVYFD